MEIKSVFFKILKWLGIIILALIVFWLGGEAGYREKYQLEVWKANRAAEKLNKQLLEMFKNDTYGGQTPEETYNLFVEALKNENVDLAVKYFVLDPDRRARYWQEFDELKKQGKLKEYVADWPAWKDWEQVKDEQTNWENMAEIWYSEMIDKPTKIYDELLKKEIEIPAGKYVQQDIFFVRSSNNIWKIETL